MSNSPLVSIVATCYNHEKYVVETLDSILGQNYANIQLIIMDDCSTDNSVQVVKDWIKIKCVDCVFIFHQENKGLCKTLNEALTYVKGEYYQVISCDDVLMLDKITKQIRVFEKYPELAIVSSNMKKIDPESKVLDKNTNVSNYAPGLKKSKDLFKRLVVGNIIDAPTALIRKFCVPDDNVYDENLIFEDMDLFLKLALHYDFYIMKEALVKYRVLSTSMSTASSFRPKINEGMIVMLSKYLGLGKDTDQIIKSHIKRYKRKLYRYTFSAFYSGETPSVEYLVKLKSMLRFNNRVKNLKKRLNKKND